MEFSQLICLFILLLIIIGLIINISTDVLLITGAILVVLFKIITPQEALSGFSNSGVLTVAALYIVAASLKETGALSIIGNKYLEKRKHQRKPLFDFLFLFLLFLLF